MLTAKTYLFLGVFISILSLTACIGSKDEPLKPDTKTPTTHDHPAVNTAPNPKISHPDQPVKQLSEKIKLMATQWQSMRHDTALDYDNIHSWIPESGIRGRYQIAKKVISVAILERIVGEKVFLNNVHAKGINYRNATKFAHYNPKFLLKLHDILKQISSNERWLTHIQPFYDNELKHYLRTYFLSYEIAANKPVIIKGYLSAIKQQKPSANTVSSFTSQGTSSSISPSIFLQESFRDFADYLEQQGYDVYEASVCSGFWVRRSIDGTEDEFFKLLKLMINMFDAEFLKNQ